MPLRPDRVTIRVGLELKTKLTKVFIEFITQNLTNSTRLWVPQGLASERVCNENEIADDLYYNVYFVMTIRSILNVDLPTK